MRPPLTFGNYKPDMKYYFRFDPDSGEVLEFSIEKKGNCVEISKKNLQTNCMQDKQIIFFTK